MVSPQVVNIDYYKHSFAVGGWDNLCKSVLISGKDNFFKCPAKILPTKDQLFVLNINIVYSYSDSDTFTTSHTLQSDTRSRYNFLVVKAEHSNGR